MLKLANITKDYKVASAYVHALKGISLEFRKNEFVCILGPSGCGKTTLLNIIGGLDHYTSGDLSIQGKSTKDFRDRDWDVYRNHRIGFIFQSYNLIPHQTVLGNVELALTIAGVGREERRERAKQALERVGLAAEVDKLPNQLSGGQMQRVAIARALVNNPDILLADEPTGALDSKTSVEVMELIKEIAGERLVIMVTHNPELAEQYATRLIRLKDGLVESDSAPYAATEEETQALREEAQTQEASKGKKAPRARMSLLTSLFLSAKNLFTKKGRTIITSVAGSIGIISVCLVLALSSGFKTYIRHTEEDMLSYYPLEIMENTLDLTAVMANAGSLENIPDLDQIGDKVYVNSFLTQLAQGIAVTNNLSKEYLSYLQKGKEEHPDWFSAIKYSYGISLKDNFFTSVVTGGVYDRENEVTTPVETKYFSLSELREFYTDELIALAPEYQSLLRYVDFFTDVIDIIPGTSDSAADDYGKYVLSQYDILDPETMHFPENENEAVLVVGSSNDSVDLTLAQLGFLPEVDFMNLFNMGQEGNELEGEIKTIPFEEILQKQYVLYYNDAVYTRRDVNGITEQPFVYSGERDGLQASEGDRQLGIPIKITAILRLKEGRTYGCLTDGINLTEQTLLKYISANKDSEIVAWSQSDAAKLPDTLSKLFGVTDMDGYRSPSAHLNTSYTAIDLGDIRSGIVSVAGERFLTQAGEMMGTLGLDFPLAGETVLKSDAVAFFQHPIFKSAIISNIDRQIEAMGPVEGDWPDGTATVESILAALEKYGDTYVFTRAEFAALLGSPLVEATVEPQLGFRLAGTIFVSYMPDTVIRLLGGNSDPNGVFIYPNDFDAKEHVLEYLDEWNKMEGRAEEDKITYTDRVGLLMGMMQTMLDVITYVLVAFTSISLVVSSVMIGIITYVSVVERVKEIGVLRSLGARKMDIRNLFNAETFIIGLAAGVIGVAVTYGISAIVNLIIYSLSGIGGIASLSPLTAFIMICVSVALTLISGLIPAQAAAKKDPVIALRTE